jgi:hypothetical protein
VHGDVTAFTFLAILFTVGAVAAALLFARRPSRPAPSKAGVSKHDQDSLPGR